MTDIEVYPETIDFGAEFKSFINDKKQYIEQKTAEIESMKGFLPTGVSLSIQNTIDNYKEILKDLEDSEKKVIDMFSLGDLSKSMERHRAYPIAISAYHTNKMLITLGVIGAGVAAVGLYAIGGTNPVTWSPALQGVAIATGLSLGGFVAVPIRIGNWRGFDRDKVEKRKFNFIEKRIMKKVKAKERALSQISLEIGKNMLPILKGEYTIHEIKQVNRKRFILFGKEETHTVIDLKEKYMFIPKRKRKKLLKIISKSKGLNDAARNLEDSLNLNTSKQKVIPEKLNEQKAVAERPIIDTPQTPMDEAPLRPAQPPVKPPQTEIIYKTTVEKEIIVPLSVRGSTPKSRSFNTEEMKLEAKDFFTKDELQLFSSIVTDFKSLKDGKLDLTKSDFSQRFVQLMLDIDDKRSTLKDLPNLNLFLSECNTELKKQNAQTTTQNKTSSSR